MAKIRFEGGRIARLGKAKVKPKDRYMPILVKAAEQQGYYIYPSAQRYIKNVIARSESVGTIEGEAERIKVALVLAAAGIEVAKTIGKTNIGIRDLQQGWGDYIRYGSGNCPPYRCSRRSIVAKSEGELEDRLPAVRGLWIK